MYCDQTTSCGGWTLFRRRLYAPGLTQYKHGFGDLIGEFWQGLDKIRRLTGSKTENRLRVELDVPNSKKFMLSMTGWNWRRDNGIPPEHWWYQLN